MPRLTTKPAALRAVPMGVFPTMGSLQEVVDYAESKIPVMNKNDMTSLLMIYHNTMLKVLHENLSQSFPTKH